MVGLSMRMTPRYAFAHADLHTELSTTLTSDAEWASAAPNVAACSGKRRLEDWGRAEIRNPNYLRLDIFPGVRVTETPRDVQRDLEIHWA